MSFSGISFPSRPVAVRGNVIQPPRGYAFLTLMMLVFAGLIAFWQAPDLIKDIEISKHPLVLQDGNIRDGRCTTRKGVFTDCEAHLAYDYNGKHYERDVELFFVDLHVGDYETDMVISSEKPELATLTIGLDKLWNRVISLAAIVLIMVAVAIGLLFQAFRAGRVRRMLRHPAELTAIPVEITAFDRSRRGLAVTYADKLSSHRTNRAAHTHFAPGEEPLVIGLTEGKGRKPGNTKGSQAVGLAVRHGRAPLPILLDSKLDRLELTEEERRAILDPIEAELAPYGGMITLNAPKRMPRILRGIVTFFAVILLFIVGLLGFWVWYVTSSETQYNQIGMELNNVMPAPMNRWGCGELQKRFGDGPAPYGCAAADFKSWK
jgi:hypothetical protein